MFDEISELALSDMHKDFSLNILPMNDCESTPSLPKPFTLLTSSDPFYTNFNLANYEQQPPVLSEFTQCSTDDIIDSTMLSSSNESFFDHDDKQFMLYTSHADLASVPSPSCDNSSAPVFKKEPVDPAATVAHAAAQRRRSVIKPTSVIVKFNIRQAHSETLKYLCSNATVNSEDEVNSEDDDIVILQDDEDNLTSHQHEDDPCNKETYFWRYNVQSKGPKTKRIVTLKHKNPHVVRKFHDPVFIPRVRETMKGRLQSKRRRGDGNDIAPNTKKLYELGCELRTVTSQLQCTGIHSKLSKKEKSKLASRACRLKKKAQHEANKLKLHCLNREHSRLLSLLNTMNAKIMFSINHPGVLPYSLRAQLEGLVAQNLEPPVAGRSDEYVQTLLDQQKAELIAPYGDSSSPSSPDSCSD